MPSFYKGPTGAGAWQLVKDQARRKRLTPLELKCSVIITA